MTWGSLQLVQIQMVQVLGLVHTLLYRFQMTFEMSLLGAPASSAGAPLILWIFQREGEISFLSITSDLEALESIENQ